MRPGRSATDSQLIQFVDVKLLLRIFHSKIIIIIIQSNTCLLSLLVLHALSMARLVRCWRFDYGSSGYMVGTHTNSKYPCLCSCQRSCSHTPTRIQMTSHSSAWREASVCVCIGPFTHLPLARKPLWLNTYNIDIIPHRRGPPFLSFELISNESILWLVHNRDVITLMSAKYACILLCRAIAVCAYFCLYVYQYMRAEPYIYYFSSNSMMLCVLEANPLAHTI